MAFNKNITFKGTSSTAYPLIITTPPQIAHPEVINEEWQIPGRDGVLFGADPYLANGVITVNMALVAQSGFTDNVSKYQIAYRQVRQWLQGTGKLILGDSPDSYFEVLKVAITTDDRQILRYGQLQVQFTVYPYEFLSSGDTGVAAGTLNNTGDEASPVYKISGTGSGTLTVHGNTMTYEVSGDLYIDTRRFISYDALGANKNSKISGDYESIRLIHGNNVVSATVGTLTIYPKWGYKL